MATLLAVVIHHTTSIKHALAASSYSNGYEGIKNRGKLKYIQAFDGVLIL